MKATLFVALLVFVSACTCNLPRTTLELAVALAWNQAVADGTWVAIFGEDKSGLMPSDNCNGPNSAWTQIEPTYFSDLLIALGHHEMVCGFNANQTFANYHGQLLLDTHNGIARGPVVRFFDAVAQKISAEYGTDFRIRWEVKYATSSETLNAVRSGEYDAACGIWAPGITYLTDAGLEQQRVDGFSLFPCNTYIMEQRVWTFLTTSSVTSFASLVAAINANPSYTVCTAETPDSWTTMSCTATLRQYVDDATYTCTGVSPNDPFYEAQVGGCHAVWGGDPGQGNRIAYHAFSGPVLSAASSFFRLRDKHADYPISPVVFFH